MLCEMQSVLSRIWTRVVVSISFDDNHYTTGTSKFLVSLAPSSSIDFFPSVAMSKYLSIFSISFTGSLEYQSSLDSKLIFVVNLKKLFFVVGI